MAPVVGQLAAGLDPMQLGPVRHTLHTITLPQAHQVGQKIAGEVVEVDSFGNLITNITDQQLASVPRGETTRVECDGHETFGIFATYGEQPEMTLVAVIGSSGQLELAIVGDSAAAMLGVRAGTAVSVVW
jgi:S-adenosylmethionine hydrolase